MISDPPVLCFDPPSMAGGMLPSYLTVACLLSPLTHGENPAIKVILTDKGLQYGKTPQAEWHTRGCNSQSNVNRIGLCLIVTYACKNFSMSHMFVVFLPMILCISTTGTCPSNTACVRRLEHLERTTYFSPPLLFFCTRIIVSSHTQTRLEIYEKCQINVCAEVSDIGAEWTRENLEKYPLPEVYGEYNMGILGTVYYSLNG